MQNINMVLGDHWYITAGQILIGCGVLAVIVITLSTHIVAIKEAKITKKKDEEILERVETIENKVHELHSLHKEVEHVPIEDLIDEKNKIENSKK